MTTTLAGPYPVRHLPHVPVPLSDGTVLSASVFLPEAEGEWSAIVDYVPYRKDDGFMSMDWDTYAPIAARGFACVRLDMRGSGSSEGVLHDEYLTLEQDDMIEAMEVLSAEPWCTGRFGMTGVSWGGFSAIQVAMRAPERLKAIVPIHATHDRYHFDVHYFGGLMSARDMADWPGCMLPTLALPPDPAIVGDRLDAIWRRRLEETPPYVLEWMRHQRRDAYWKHGSVIEDYASIRCPVLAIGGWHDTYRDCCLELLEHLDVPCRAIIGPWSHTRPHRAWPSPGIDHRVEIARWMARWLDGVANGVEHEPALTVFMCEGIPADPVAAAIGGEWRSFSGWRPAEQPRSELHGADGRLGAAVPAVGVERWSGPWSVGAGAPFACTGGPPMGHSGDMTIDDRNSLSFTTEPLAEALDILGYPLLRLRVSADQPVASVCARLEHVHPDGHSAFITRSALNLTRRDSFEDPQPVEPGRAYDVELRFMSTGTTIPAGHRLRVAIAGADYPMVIPPPQPFTLTLHSGPGIGPTLVLPQPDGALAVAVAPLVPAPAADDSPSPVKWLDSSPYESWTTVRDHSQHRTGTVVETRHAAILPSGARYEIGSHVQSWIDDDDPGSGRELAVNDESIRHPDGLEAEALSTLEIEWRPSGFLVRIRLEVHRGDEVLFEREWDERIPRDLM